MLVERVSLHFRPVCKEERKGLGCGNRKFCFSHLELNPDRSGKFLGFTNAFKFPDGRYIKVGFIDANGNGIEPPAGVTGQAPAAGAPAPRAGGGD